MRIISSSGTLTDTIVPGHASEVIFSIQVFEPGTTQNLTAVTFVLRKDGQEILNGQYDLEDKVTGAWFRLRKTPSGWKV